MRPDIIEVIVPGPRGLRGDLSPEQTAMVEQGIAAAPIAVSAADRAEAARDAAAGTGRMYPDIPSGLAATEDGEYFAVADADAGVISLYRNEGGAVPILDFPSTAAYEAIASRIYPAPASGLAVTVTDKDRFRTWLEAEDATGGPTEWSRFMMCRVIPALDEDGHVSDEAVTSIGERLAPSVVGGQRLTDTTKISAWGASDVQRLDPALAAMATSLGAAYFSGGTSNGHLDPVWSEQGSRENRFSVPGNTIPATTNQITGTWETGEDIGGIRWMPVIVEGTDVTGEQRGNRFRRTGVVAGITQPVTLNGPVRLISRNGVAQADGVQLWSVGLPEVWNGSLTESMDEVIERVTAATDLAYSRLPTVDRRVLVLGHWVPRDVDPSPTLYVRESVKAANDYYRARYQERFIDIAAYLASAQVWTHTGITPTSADLTAQANGSLPPSLSDDATHIGVAGNAAIVNNLILPRMVALGWY